MTRLLIVILLVAVIAAAATAAPLEAKQQYVLQAIMQTNPKLKAALHADAAEKAEAQWYHWVEVASQTRFRIM